MNVAVWSDFAHRLNDIDRVQLKVRTNLTLLLKVWEYWTWGSTSGANIDDNFFMMQWHQGLVSTENVSTTMSHLIKKYHSAISHIN